jgi:hypothetical protein
MRKKLRLKPFEAIALGFIIQERNSNKFSNPQYYLSQQQYTELLKLRNLHESEFKEVKRTLNKDGEVITKVEKLTSKELIDIPLNHQIKRVSTNVATNQQWVITEPIKGVDVEKEIENLHKLFLEDLKNYSPKYNTYTREVKNEPHLLVIDPADIHIGKLCSAFEVGEEYNNQIAVQRVLSGVNGILDKVSSLNIDKILFVIGNDILHIDNPKRTTTGGTPQDTDGMWHSNFLIAKQLYVDIIEKLICVSNVEVVFNPSNHDYTNGFFLAQVIESHFRNCENVNFNCSISHRKYFVYGENLIGTSHGDGAKQIDLPMLMAHESKDWVNCKHKYFYIHHFHHKISKDYMSVCVEALRTPSGTDSWHHKNGYEHAPKAVEGFVHHKKHGQIMRITHLF